MNIEHPGIRECQITGGRDTPDDTEYKCPECGTVGMVAKQEGRRFIGIDINPDYSEMAFNRINNSK